MEEIKNSIPCETCEYYLAETNECGFPQDQEKPCKHNADGASLGLGTLYDLNKNIMTQMKTMSDSKIKDLIADLSLSLGDRYQYYMLLNNELRDYTLFNFYSKNTSCVAFREDLYECLYNRGNILAIDKKDNNTYEIWLRANNGEILCYYFFPYDLGVLEYA